MSLAPLLCVSGALLRERTRAYAEAVARFVDRLPATRQAHILGDQLLRSAASAGAAYRAACRAQSRNDFLAKLAIVEQEADESAYWLDLCAALGIGETDHARRLEQEAAEIVAMTVASIRTARITRPSHPKR